MYPQRRGGARNDDFKKRKDAVERVFGGVAPRVVGDGEPHARVNQPPVDGCDDKRVGGDGGVEEGVEGLEGARETVDQKGSAGACVGEGVEGGGEVVKGEPPVGEDGEVGVFVAGGGAAAFGGVGAVVAGLEEEDEETVATL